MEDVQGIGPWIQGEKTGKFPCLLAKGVAVGKILRKRSGKDLKSLRGRQHNPTLIAMIPQVIRDGNRQGNYHRSDARGKAFHECTVLGSMATGMPLAFRAQCLVNPRQTSTPVSAWVMR